MRSRHDSPTHNSRSAEHCARYCASTRREGARRRWFCSLLCGRRDPEALAGRPSQPFSHSSSFRPPLAVLLRAFAPPRSFALAEKKSRWSGRGARGASPCRFATPQLARAVSIETSVVSAAPLARALRRLRASPPHLWRRAAASAAGGDQLAVAFAQRGVDDVFLRAALGVLGRGGPDSSTAAAPRGDLDAPGLVSKARTSCAMPALLHPRGRTRLVRSL